MSVFSQLRDEHVGCRTLLHAWKETDDEFGDSIQVAFANSRSVEKVNFKCLRCNAYRLEGWSKVTGDLLWRVYRLPEGYRLKRGAGATRKKMRREYLERRRKNPKWEAPPSRRSA